MRGVDQVVNCRTFIKLIDVLQPHSTEYGPSVAMFSRKVRVSNIFIKS
jgi:hypothetical protein